MAVHKLLVSSNAFSIPSFLIPISSSFSHATHIGTFQENTLALWSSQDYSLLTASTLTSAVHEVQWDPYTAYEFTAVGAKASISFWVVEEEMREGRYQMKVC